MIGNRRCYLQLHLPKYQTKHFGLFFWNSRKFGKLNGMFYLKIMRHRIENTYFVLKTMVMISTTTIVSIVFCYGLCFRLLNFILLQKLRLHFPNLMRLPNLLHHLLFLILYSCMRLKSFCKTAPKF